MAKTNRVRPARTVDDLDRAVDAALVDRFEQQPDGTWSPAPLSPPLGDDEPHVEDTPTDSAV